MKEKIEQNTSAGEKKLLEKIRPLNKIKFFTHCLGLNRISKAIRSTLFQIDGSVIRLFPVEGDIRITTFKL